MAASFNVETMDIVLGLIAGLQADAGVTASVGVNVFDFELPISQDLVMPAPAIVIRPNGGPKNFEMLQLNDSRISLICYGPTPHLAYTAYVAAYQCFKAWTPSVLSHTYIHWVNEESGPIPLRDPELQWPYNVSQWNVRASDLTV